MRKHFRLLFVLVSLLIIVSCRKQETDDLGWKNLEGTWQIGSICNGDCCVPLNIHGSFSVGDAFIFTGNDQLRFDMAALPGIQAEGDWTISAVNVIPSSDTLSDGSPASTRHTLSISGQLTYLNTNNYSQRIEWNEVEKTETNGIARLDFFWQGTRFTLYRK